MSKYVNILYNSSNGIRNARVTKRELRNGGDKMFIDFSAKPLSGTPTLRSPGKHLISHWVSSSRVFTDAKSAVAARIKYLVEERRRKIDALEEMQAQFDADVAEESRLREVQAKWTEKAAE